MNIITRDFDPMIDKPKGNPINGGISFTWESGDKRWRYTFYNNRIARTDNYVKFTTKYYEGSKQLMRWFRRFEKQWLIDFNIMKENKIRQHRQARKLFFSIVDK